MPAIHLRHSDPSLRRVAACGRVGVLLSDYPDQVTCKSCQLTQAYLDATGSRPGRIGRRADFDDLVFLGSVTVRLPEDFVSSWVAHPNKSALVRSALISYLSRCNVQLLPSNRSTGPTNQAD